LVPHASSESTPAALAGEALAGKELALRPRVRTHELHRAR
jgi:hypothetical protein